MKRPCPECKGKKGKYVHPAAGFGLNPGNRMVWRECRTCRGTGTAPSEEQGMGRDETGGAFTGEACGGVRLSK